MYYARDLLFNTKRSVEALAKTEVLEWNAFMRGDVLPKAALATSTPTYLLVISPQVLAAAGNASSTWAEIFATVLTIADYLCVGVIIFAGATWMFGNRTKAIELLLGGAIGYLIIRHAEDIMHWLKNL